MAYLNEHMIKACEARDEIITELTSAEDKATDNVHLQNKFLTFHEYFDIKGLVHFDWGHSTNRLPKLSQSLRSSGTKSCAARMPSSKRSTLSAIYVDKSASFGSVDLLNALLLLCSTLELETVTSIEF